MFGSGDASNHELVRNPVNLTIPESVLTGLKDRASVALDQLFTRDASGRLIPKPDNPDVIILIGGGADLAWAYYSAFFKKHGVDLPEVIPVIQVMVGTDLPKKSGVNTDHLSADWFAGTEEQEVAEKTYLAWLDQDPRARNVVAELKKQFDNPRLQASDARQLRIALWDDQIFTGATTEITVPYLIELALKSDLAKPKFKLEPTFLMVADWKDEIIKANFPEVAKGKFAGIDPPLVARNFLGKLMSGFVTVEDSISRIRNWNDLKNIGLEVAESWKQPKNPADVFAEKYTKESLVALPDSLRSKLAYLANKL